jgi:homoserine kinase
MGMLSPTSATISRHTDNGVSDPIYAGVLASIAFIIAALDNAPNTQPAPVTPEIETTTESVRKAVGESASVQDILVLEGK